MKGFVFGRNPTESIREAGRRERAPHPAEDDRQIVKTRGVGMPQSPAPYPRSAGIRPLFGALSVKLVPFWAKNGACSASMKFAASSINPQDSPSAFIPPVTAESFPVSSHPSFASPEWFCWESGPPVRSPKDAWRREEPACALSTAPATALFPTMATGRPPSVIAGFIPIGIL